MSSPVTSAIACNFAHTTASPDVAVTFAAGASPVTASLATGTYRMWLATSTGCYIRALCTALKSAVATARGTLPTVVATLSSAGILTITFGVDVPAGITFASGVWQRLGFASASPTITGAGVITGTLPVWHLVTFVSQRSADWIQRTPSASSETAGGDGYGVTSGITSWRDEVTFDLIPRDITFRTSLSADQTAWEPEPAYLATLGTVGARAYSLSDFLRDAFCKTCAYTRDFPSILSSTTVRYDIVALVGRDCTTPRVSKLVDNWDAYRSWIVALIRQSTPTGTRA